VDGTGKRICRARPANTADLLKANDFLSSNVLPGIDAQWNSVHALTGQRRLIADAM
jgi:hypothetical protein